jgi:hypothetical protein
VESPWFAVDAAWVDPTTATYARVTGGWDDGRYSNSATAWLEQWTEGAEPERLNRMFVDTQSTYNQTRVARMGDLDGDGLPDLAANLDGIAVRAAFVDESFTMEPVLDWTDADTPFDRTAAGFQPIACDADRDGQADLCTSRGFDLGPIDGGPEATWDPGVPYGWERIAIGRTGETTTAWVARSGGVTAIDLGEATGDVDLDALPFWAADGDLVSALAAVPTDGDDLLAVCSGVSSTTVTHLRIFDGVQDSDPILTLSRACDELDVGDFDGDGDPEIAVASDSTIQIIELDGTVRSTLQGVYDPGSDGLGSGMDSADVDGDGRDDLIAAARHSSTLYITLRAIDEP